ncbi:hypothetical protein [Roseibium salinum]|uniref:Tissue inhibitor of metalloproteinase n=1 Tax=Roseibium salinum TaxID=1604349 RepID=A0ABT3QZS6_9HYPH|nr:hypothetical protein [Roseibium sp. DSM 29163]MCX2722473.1 hypothetical protein [Roseibium sp. DSM 29163]MDN3719560.1 hypothetical protein [Roseibium salinum]
MTFKALTLAASLSALLFSAGSAQACRCKPLEDIPEAYSAADLVVFGEVAAIEGSLTSAQGQVVDFRAEATWKSPARSPLQFVNRTTCAMDLKIGQTYLLFLHKLPDEETGYGANKCTGSLSGKEAEKAAEMLGDVHPETR